MITPEQRAERRKYIGSSDVAAICGKDPYRTAMDVYLSKTQEIDDKPTPAMEMGKRLEAAALDWFEQEMKKPIRRNVQHVAEDGIFAANFDALVLGKPEGVEAKTANIMYPSEEAAAKWGEEGTDEVPDHVVLQCQEQMYVGNLQSVWVPALIGGRGWKLYRVERNDKLIRTIVGRGRDFWLSFVLPKEPPPDSVPALEVARAVKRVEGKTCNITIEPTQRLLTARGALKAAQAEAEAAEALFLTYMGDAETADTPLGQFSFKEQTRHYLDNDKIRREWPDAADACEKVSAFRVLRHKQPKENR